MYISQGFFFKKIKSCAFIIAIYIKFRCGKEAAIMHDVIIDDTQNCFVATTQMEERKEKLKKEAKPKRKERLAPYLIDWLEKALVIASLISLNFLIYVGAGSYDMFSSYTILTPEVWYILSGIIIFSILIKRRGAPSRHGKAPGHISPGQP